MTTGLYLGKFAPFHKGHEQILNRALQDCDKVAVVVTNDLWFDIQHPALDKVTRAYWLKNAYPEVDVRIGFNPPADDYTDVGNINYGRWVAGIFEYSIDLLYGGEEWVRDVAAGMGADYRHLDRDGKGISATKIRDNPAEYAWYMRPEIRDYMLIHYGTTKGLHI